MPCSFEILPIAGREVVQKNFARLPEKSDSYSNRSLTLNERFAIIERGYYLKPEKLQTDSATPRVVKLKPFEQFGTVEEIISDMKAALDKKKKPTKDSHSNHTMSTGTQTSSIDSQKVLEMDGTSRAPLKEHSKRRVTYIYDKSIGNYYYGPGHAMNPHRVRLAHDLILNYGLQHDMNVHTPPEIGVEAMTTYHGKEYINFLEQLCFDGSKDYYTKDHGFGVGGDDCPPFNGIYEFSQLSVGGTIGAAVLLNRKDTDIAINWMGGLHHAKKNEASGFCYTNDIVIGILELLKRKERVLYVDIDVHHGDGVQEAFFHTDRVMTVSFHKYGGDFFPGTGELKIMTKVMERYRPSAVVLQCGADSLNEDRLGKFNLTLKGHGECVSFFRAYTIPLMLLGGGGYTPLNVARCWAYETSLAVDRQVPDEVFPSEQYRKLFGDYARLHIDPSNERDQNTRESLKKIQDTVLARLEQMNFAPSVQMQPIPKAAVPDDDSLARDMADPDERLPRAVMDERVSHSGEYYDGGDDRME